MSLYYEPDPADDTTEPQLPPLLTPLEVEKGRDVQAKAVSVAAKGEVGVVCYSADADNLRMAITLAPEVTPLEAVQMHFVLMIALGDSIGALAPPEVAVTYRFPGAILLNRGYAGWCGIEIDETADEKGCPGWMIVHAQLALRGELTAGETGEIPDETSLSEEGGSYISRTRLLESVCRHFLVWLNRWDDEGFRPVHDMWKSRLDGTSATVEPSLEWMGLDGDGAGLARRDGAPVSLSLLDPAVWVRPK
jgi:biotin-(acetyl-CoA carboxylase) ligase